MSDGTDIVSIVGGGLGGTAGVAFVVKYVWDSVKGRRDVLEGKAEESRDDKIDQVLSKLTALELDMRSLVEKLSTQAATVARVEARVEGISSNHGSRLGTMEQTAVELRTRITQLETAGNKRRR